MSARNGQLIIEGKHQEDQKVDKENWLHQGIRRNQFQLQFGINRGTKINGATLANGLLEISLEQEIPEEDKPKKIAIQSAESPKSGKVIEQA